MYLKFKEFMSKDDGAITVDWVVLCAAVVGLAIALVTSTRDGAVELADRTIVFTPGEF
ncbi:MULTISPECIES: hypothetical protein [unclassified Sulfitobacter]|jgi:hypothetical protein|uniref:hypothetical protein n=1 Tax=unclassified Sulfitobacter TaxID=196795 RepID=UPI001593D8FC|nr:hypothetical protein [Sulfitobacter sp. HGT1]MBQ0806309.1 hypothetical protein [Sulfitobacter sp.]